MNTNYSSFSYNDDFTPTYNIFNTNTSNKRFVGIGTHKPKHFLDITGNVSTSNLIINNNFLYNNNTNLINYDLNNPSNIHLFQVDSSNKIITPNLVSSNYQETGTEWSIVNNNNIKLTLRNINDNTRFHYESVFFTLVSDDANVNIYLNSSFTLKYLYIIKNGTNNNLLEQVDINSITSSNVLLTTNNLSSTITYTNNIFKLDSFITLAKGSHTINLKELTGFKIQFIGTYEYYAGSLWNKNNNINTVISLKNVGIGTTILDNNLHVLGNTVISSNLTVNNKLTTNILNINELNNVGITNLSHIEPISNNLIINSDRNVIGIGSTNPDDFINIGSHFKIKKNGNIVFNNLNINNNLNITNKISLVNSKSSITFNNSSNIIYKLNNKTIIDDNNKHLNLNNNLIIDASNNSNSNNNSNNNDTMFVHGNVNILGNLTTSQLNKPFIYNPNENQIHTSLNSNNTVINSLLSCSGYLHTDTLESTNIDILNYFKITRQADDIPLFNYPYIYYNTSTKQYKVFNNNTVYNLSNNISILDFSHIVKVFSNNASNITYINTNTLTTNILENNKIFMCNNAQIYFNNNSLTDEIHYNNNIQYFDLF